MIYYTSAPVVHITYHWCYEDMNNNLKGFRSRTSGHVRDHFHAFP